MGITVSYRRISKAQFLEIQANSQLALEFFYGESGKIDRSELLDLLLDLLISETLPSEFSNEIKSSLSKQSSVYQDNFDLNKTWLSIEKEWQAIHYLLTGEVACDRSSAEPPLNQVIFGGTETEFEATYGYVRYFTPDEVKEIAIAIAQLPEIDLRIRFNEREDLELYAQSDKWDEEDWEFLKRTLKYIHDFFAEAAKNNEIVLISSD
ncbi:hypothetical protein CKA32_006603 [Geitlerinema sp. FC II]|nr:DUF1877 family protein [Geitlerinema sp. CS-897]PPT10381.1 hypothetical protein CKA32_006603 [Geitlerinema sp. FC II]